MAPSPELGQPKAPDKSSVSSVSSSKQNANDINHTSPRIADSISNCGNNMTSTTNTSGGSNSSGNSCSGASQENSSKDLKHMNDVDFQDLLDEALSYKNPNDRKNKSETFQQLLLDVERTKDQFPPINEQRYRRNPKNEHGGSLQDLKESGASDIIDNEYTYGKNNRRHQRTQRIHNTSVSARSREGGSLPSNVNVSLNEPRFDEFGFKRRGKAERTFSGASSNSGQDSIVSYESKDDSVLGDHTTITEIDISEDGSQGKHNPVGDEGYATMNLKTTLEISCPESKISGHWVDDTVSFSSLERSKANVIDATTCALPFDDSSKSCQSILGEKPEKPKSAIFQASKVTTPQVDENGNAIVAKKKKKHDADRNTTTVDVTKVEGYRGHDDVESLVKFIEIDNNVDTTRKSDKLSSVASGKKKDKRKDKDFKKDIQKVKKSTSLEELRSCTKLDEDDKLTAGVIMRSKGKKNSLNAATPIPNDGKENVKQNSKRGERRSWGTEELTYLGENNAIEEVREKNKEREKSKKAKEFIEKQQDKAPEKDKLAQKKKKNERSLSVLSMESAQSETAEFLVVTKKKRSKKRQSLEETRTIVGKGANAFPHKSAPAGHKKYQSSNSFSNDRDAYLRDYNPHESRRKSTSSVPPSDKSDSSDLDSVHSLPIESVSNRHQMSSSAQLQHQSYADIARTVNANKYNAVIAWQPASGNQNEVWPTVSGMTGSNTTSPASTETSSQNPAVQPLTNSKNRSLSAKSKSLAKDFPDLSSDRNKMSNSYDCASSCSSSSSTSTVVKQVSQSQSWPDDKNPVEVAIMGSGKSVTPPNSAKLTDVVRGNETARQTLQKSKSADNERFYSVEQYPALEKTVKRHSTQNPISDIKSLQNTSVGSILASSTGSQTALNKQRMPAAGMLPVRSQQQQQNLEMFEAGPTTVSLNANSCASSITTATIGASCNTAANASTSTATSALSDTSKIVINNNLDLNTKLATTSSSSNNNVVNIISSSANSASSITITNNGMKSKVNTKASAESPPPPPITTLVEMNNVKNSTTQQLPTQVVNHSPISGEELAQNPIQSNPITLSSDMQKQLQLPGNTAVNRKPKKEKQSIASALASDEMSQSQQANSFLHGKHPNRPAVIILNDLSDGGRMCGGGDFTFGDFNEEERRLFECNPQLDDSGSYNISTQDVNCSSSITSDTVHEDVHLSPHSDQGYSSSNNRSIFSESMDQGNAPSMGTLPQRGAGTYLVSEIESNLVALHSASTSESDDQKMGSSSMSSLPIDSAIIMATKGSSLPLHESSSQFQQPTNLGSNPLPASSLVAPATSKVLSHHNTSNSASSKKIQDITNNELTKYDVNVTKNDLMEINSCSDNVNISNMKNNSSNDSSIGIVNHETTQITPSPLPATKSSMPSSAASSSLMTTSSIVGKESSLLPSSSSSMDNHTNNNYATNRFAAGSAAINSNIRNARVTSSSGAGASMSSSSLSSSTSATNIQPNTCCDNNNMMKRLINTRKEINIRFVAPPVTHDINSTNYEKLVDFVGLAWRDVLHGRNGETEYYNGQ